MINNYEDFKKQVFSITSIDLNAYKEKQMKRRIDTLIARNKYDGYESYIKAIKSDSKLLDEFVNYLTINVSEFYRNPALWKKLEDIILPELINKFGTRLKIWSAACSTGDEPYSLAMVLAKKVPMRDIKIYATDIDDLVIQDHIRHEQTSALSLSFIRESFFHSFPCDILYPAGQIIGCLPFFLYPVQAARPIGLPHPQSLFPQVPCTIFSLCL